MLIVQLVILAAGLCNASSTDDLSTLMRELRVSFEEDQLKRSEMAELMRNSQFFADKRQERLDMVSKRPVIDQAVEIIAGTPLAKMLQNAADMSRNLDRIAMELPAKHASSLQARLVAVARAEQIAQAILSEFMVVSPLWKAEAKRILQYLQESETIYIRDQETLASLIV